MSNNTDEGNVIAEYECMTTGCTGKAEIHGGLGPDCKLKMYPAKKTFEDKLKEMKTWGLKIDRREQEITNKRMEVEQPSFIKFVE